MSDAEQNLKVLVVDDSSVYRKLIADTLYYQPYTVYLAQSGREALDLFAKHSPSVVITDWLMPDLTGLELCQQIRANAQNGYTYIILLTSMTEKDSVVQGLEAGADDYLTKPCDPGELQARIAVGRRIVELYSQVESKNRELDENTRIDSLTGLPNYRAVKEIAAWQLKSATRHRFPVWAILADLDSFETINSAFGREAGDAVLKAFAQIMSENSQPSDLCGRIGDDEFICVLTHAPEPQIAAIIERFRRAFEERTFTFEGNTIALTASFGAARFEGTETVDIADLIRDADKALYAAKEAGGNLIRIAA